MATPFVGQIMLFGGNFAPVGWALCNGQIIEIEQNEALFSVIGSTYGGNGRTTFGLPDLRGRVPVHFGSGPGLSTYSMGQKFGVETVQLTANQIPAHTHQLRASGDSTGTTNVPTGNVLAVPESNGPQYHGPLVTTVNTNSTAIGPTGTSSHKNIQPFQCVNFCIALIGIIPSQT